jgi:hypothetical protein
MINHAISVENITGSHTGEVLKTALNEIFDTWEISDKVHFLITDNASNIVKAAELLNQSNPDIKHVRCVGHIINLIVKKFSFIKKRPV